MLEDRELGAVVEEVAHERSLPEMGDWDSVFDETVPPDVRQPRRRSRAASRRDAAKLAEMSPARRYSTVPAASVAMPFRWRRPVIW